MTKNVNPLASPEAPQTQPVPEANEASVNTSANAPANGDAMAPAGVEFVSVSPALVKVRLIGNGLLLLIFAIAFAIPAVLVTKWFLFGVGAAVLVFLWLLWLIPRQVRAMGYATTETDFLVRKGIMFRSLSVIPYGRIQYVDLSEGPVARHYGISQITLHTASAETDAQLDGVPQEQASRLRDIFSKNSTADMQGI